MIVLDVHESQTKLNTYLDTGRPRRISQEIAFYVSRTIKKIYGSFSPTFIRSTTTPSCFFRLLIGVVVSRQPLFCVPVPGQSSWAQPCDGDSQLSTAAHNELGHGAPKRLRDTDVDAMNDEVRSIRYQPQRMPS